jgi:hypothetical protein
LLRYARVILKSSRMNYHWSVSRNICLPVDYCTPRRTVGKKSLHIIKHIYKDIYDILVEIFK